MRRVIFGAVALLAAALAAVGITGRRRRVRVDEWLPVEPAPPLGATGAGDAPTPAGDAIAGEPTGAMEAAASAESVEPSVEADYGPVGAAAPKERSKPRTRPRRTSAAAAAPSSEGDAASS